MQPLAGVFGDACASDVSSAAFPGGREVGTVTPSIDDGEDEDENEDENEDDASLSSTTLLHDMPRAEASLWYLVAAPAPPSTSLSPSLSSSSERSLPLLSSGPSASIVAAGIAGPTSTADVDIVWADCCASLAASRSRSSCLRMRCALRSAMLLWACAHTSSCSSMLWLIAVGPVRYAAMDEMYPVPEPMLRNDWPSWRSRASMAVP
mmetsp:Transcript_8689/g.15508  ORF Transcript_8689/g.15508 Transcript_8689/m.15508 type:complete len:207 (-) Transcript_8689:261-881(-)